MREKSYTQNSDKNAAQRQNSNINKPRRQNSNTKTTIHETTNRKKKTATRKERSKNRELRKQWQTQTTAAKQRRRPKQQTKHCDLENCNTNVIVKKKQQHKIAVVNPAHQLLKHDIKNRYSGNRYLSPMKGCIAIPQIVIISIILV